MQASTEVMNPASHLQVDLWNDDTSQQLNRLLVSDALREMVEGNDYRALDMGFSFSHAILDKCIVISGRPMRTNVHTFYPDLLLKVHVTSGNLSMATVELQIQKRKMSNFKKIVVNGFGQAL